MRILVTGGKGMIAAPLVKALARKEFDAGSADLAHSVDGAGLLWAAGIGLMCQSAGGSCL